MITVYTRPGCGACVATKVWLNRNGVEYREVDIRTEALPWSLGYTSLPVVVVSEDEHWSGFRVDRLAALKTFHPGNNSGVIEL